MNIRNELRQHKGRPGTLYNRIRCLSQNAWGWCLEFWNRSEILQIFRSIAADPPAKFQISKSYRNLNTQSPGLETLEVFIICYLLEFETIVCIFVGNFRYKHSTILYDQD